MMTAPLKSASFALLLGLSTLSVCRCAEVELPPCPTFDAPALKAALLQDEQLVVGAVQKGQCGEPCAKLETFMAKLQQNMKGYFKTAIVDVRTTLEVGGDEMTMHTMYNITNIPQIFVYRYGVKDPKAAMTLTSETVGQVMGMYETKDASHKKQVHDVFLQFLPNRVERVNKGSLKEWLQKSPQKARVLLVTARTVTPPMYNKLSLDYGAGMLFGELRKSDPGAVEELKALGGPTIDKFPKLLTQKALGEGWAAPTEVYSGALGLAPIGEALAKINPGPFVPELTNQKVMEAECSNKGGICVVAVLPARFEKDLATFKKAVASRWFGDSGVALANFVWINEEKQEPFVDALKVENFPGLVALNPRKKLYSVYVGSFQEENLHNFVLRVLGGKEKLSKADTIPKLENGSPTMPSGKLDALFGKKEL